MTTRPTSEASASQEAQFKSAPIATSLALIAFINWFVFVGISMHVGGDAIGVKPSADGFVVKSHGNRTKVTEQVWLFSLIYPYCTLMLSPAVVFLFAVRQKAPQKVATPMKWLVIGFIGLWAFGWYGSITKSFMRSLSDYKSFKHANQGLQQGRVRASVNNQPSLPRPA
jgi:hypothetical protein